LNKLKLKKKNIIKKKFESLDQLVFEKRQNIYLDVLFDKPNEVLNLYVQFYGQGLPTVINFHGAVNQKKTIMPHFTGTTLSKFLKCNVISISDPSLRINKDLTSCWYIGSKNFELSSVLPAVLEKIKKKFLSKKIILFGSSGGGFAALYYSRILSCECIVNSPCTTLTKHPKPKLVEHSISKMYNLKNPDQIYKFLHQKKTDLNFDYELKNKLKIFINENDKRVLQFFLNPFWKQFGISLENGQYKSPNINGAELKIIKFKKKEAHTYPPLPMLIDEFKKSLWSEL
tara:strand:+ start:462 stop:1319 length:858 start_codon:yes stop_codon:yes gene_type:complete